MLSTLTAPESLTMPKFAGIPQFDGGPDALRTRAATTGRIKAHLISGYTVGDSYATVVAASLGNVNLAPGDIVSAGASGATRVTTIASKAITLSAGHAGTTLHYAVVDSTTSEVLNVSTATSDVTPVVSGGVWTSGTVLLNQTQPT